MSGRGRWTLVLGLLLVCGLAGGAPEPAAAAGDSVRVAKAKKAAFGFGLNTPVYFRFDGPLNFANTAVGRVYGLEAFIEHLSASGRRTPGTVQAYRTDLGQYARFLAHHYDFKPTSLLKYDGLPFTPAQVLHKIEEVAANV